MSSEILTGPVKVVSAKPEKRAIKVDTRALEMPALGRESRLSAKAPPSPSRVFLPCLALMRISGAEKPSRIVGLAGAACEIGADRNWNPIAF